MKNLNLWDISTQKFSFYSTNHFCACYGHHEDSATGELYMCSNDFIVSNYKPNGDIKWSKDLTEILSSDNTPVNITYLGLANCVCLGFANGELITLSDLGNNCDLTGTCENGLLSMEWSPDQELLVLVTKDLNVILMSCTFDPINESNLLSNEFGEKQFITVGWGKKETQFHGSAGKQAAQLKTDVIAGKNGELDDKILITWRGDGNLFAVGYLIDGIRQFKVFDRDGNLQYTSEKQTGLEANLSWRPSGNLIATTQKLNDQYMVAFFEKNGLKHGEFTIPVESTTIVEDLFWSSDSEILALLCKDNASNIQKVLLFTCSNYHWYLKQTLLFNEQQNIVKIMWDNDFTAANNKKMHIILQDGQHYCYTWIWNIDHSTGKSDCDDAVVAVIDGKKILISAFRYTTVPPPMANKEIEMDCYIESILFAPETDTNIDSNTFVVKCNNKLVFLEQNLRNPLRYEIYKTVYLDDVHFPFQSYNWFWLDNDTFICTMVTNDGFYQLNQFQILDEKLIQQNIQSLPSSVTRIQCHPTLKSVVFLQLKSGEILEYRSNGTIAPQISAFSEACPKFCILFIDSDIYFLGLSHRGCLYINDKMIMNNISSIFIHTSYLLLTTLKHVLICIELTKHGLYCIEFYDKPETSTDVYKRKIERGAKLVIAVPKQTRTVLQMPRGNLETIEPRPLSLKIIGEHLNNGKYFDAFDLMRKQRINLNLIYDHNPKLFTENIQMFFDAIQNNSWLNLFLSDLENIDVTKTMYASSYPERNKVGNKSQDGKVQHVCDIVIKHIIKAYDYDYRILPLLTAFVKKNELEKALDVVSKLKNKESSDLPVSSDEALKYLLYMVNVDQLFDVALGMYDFDLVLQVANKSQKDPKEYVAMLNELNEMDENYKRFTINKHLKRFDKAVQSLAQCGPNKYHELKTFVKYHSLYREALALFSIDEDIYKQISDDFGLYLKLKKQYIEAGIIYERAKIYDKAIECYKEALEWELVLKLAKEKSKDELKVLCWSLANALKEEKRYKEALTILEQFDEDNEDKINFAIECHQFKTALLFCSKFNKEQLIEKKLVPTLLEEYNNTKDLIVTNWGNFNNYRNRLQIVRELKRKTPVEHFDRHFSNKDSDLYSDAGSTIASSSGSGRSYRSSKNRRKHERKVASLKEGSQYEDTALVMALHTLVTSTYELRSQVKEVIIALSCLGKDFEALTLQSSLEKTLKHMKDSFKEIWSNELTLEATNAAIAADSVPEGSSVIPQGMATLENHMRIAPLIQDLQWKLEGLNL